MRTIRLALCGLVAGLAVAPQAGAAVPHTVQPGETLWSIAAANNFTTRSLAAANGLSETSNVVLGSTIMIPSVPEAAAALQSQAPAAGAPVQTSAPSAQAPPPMGAYTVRPGDSLSAIAARSGVSMQALAAMNGLDPGGVLLSGIPLKLPTGAPQVAAPQPAPTKAPPPAAPSATPGRVTSSEIAQIASAHGVPPSLASAIAWQESGFNNGMVSSAGARGVMQVMPGTWDWVQQNLTREPLDPSSATSNVHAGVLYLGQLLRDTGGDPSMAAAAYYQGLGSVRSQGLLPETQRYVANVNALRARFGG